MTNFFLTTTSAARIPLFSLIFSPGGKIVQRQWRTRLIVAVALLGLGGIAQADTLSTYAVTSDTRIDSDRTTRNYGVSSDLKLIVNSADHYSGSYVRLLVDIPDSALAAAKIAVASGSLDSVRLYLDFWWVSNASGETMSTRSVVAHPLTQSWVEGTGDGSATGNGATFLTYDGMHSWATAGGDYDSSVSIKWTAVNSSSDSGWYYFDLTSLLKSGYDLSDGLILLLSPETPVVASNSWCTYDAYSSECASAVTPYIAVTTVPEPSTIAMLSTACIGALLFFRRQWKRLVELDSHSNAA